MKKYLTGIILIAIIATGVFYFYIPSTQKYSFALNVNCTESAASRQIINKAKWKLWWPGQIKDDTIYTYRNFQYSINKILLYGVETTLSNATDSVKGLFRIDYSGIDIAQIQFTANYAFSANPLKRFTQYFKFKQFKNNISSLLQDIKKYFDQPQNIYGMKVVEQKVTESAYISYKKTYSQYPTIAEIYAMIQSLKDYVLLKGGKEKGYPMLHVEIEGPAIYETMVAIPTNIELPAEGEFRPKKMILGNILMGEIKGGNNTILTGEKELANYVNDYKKLSPAISFQSLVTNRLLEADTTKWVTRLYYPIFQ